MPTQEAYRVLIEHAVRCWDAERENAERLVSRMKTMSAISGVMLGVGLYRVEWLYNPTFKSAVRYDCVTWMIRFLLATAVVSLAAALFAAAGRTKRKKRPNSSWHLAIGESSFKSPPQSEEEASLVIWERVHHAHLSLMRRNAELDEKLRWSMRVLWVGIFASFAALLLFVVFSVPPTMTSAEVETHDNRQSSNPATTRPDGYEPAVR